MKWPEKPTCHKGEPHMPSMAGDRWTEADKIEERPFRFCSYCGSIHPEDLLHFLANGATLEQADWKYGWPHKFYVKGIPNPRAGQTVEVGCRYEGGKAEPIMGTAPETIGAKWYNQHLLDSSYDDEAWAAVVQALRVSGVLFLMPKKQELTYRKLTAEEMKENDEPKPD